MQYYSGRVVKPDQTKLGSTKPNSFDRQLQLRLHYLTKISINNYDFIFELKLIETSFFVEG